MAGQVETLTVKFNLDDSGFKSKMNGINSSLGKIPSSTKSATSSIKNTAAGMLVAKGATSGLNLVMGQMGAAVSRVDKLNAFPRTLKLMGISAKKAKTSTNDLRNGIQGLPSTLQNLTGNTQRLVASGLKIGDATKMTLSLNDAMLANGSSTEEAQNAMTQYSQILATGKVDQQSWNSLVVAMPSALKKVSTGLLGAGSSQADLKDALQSGKVSMNEFNDAMIKADGGTSGFHKQALEATKGIGTGFKNMKARITNGLADAVDSVNDFVQSVTGSSIGDIFLDIGSKVGNALRSGGQALKSVAPQIKAAIQGISNVMKSLGNNDIFKSLAVSAGAVAGAIGVARGAMTAWQTAVKIATAVQTAFNAVMAMNPFALIALAIVGAVAGLTFFFTKTKTGQKIWKALSTTVGNFFGGIGNWISQAISAIGQFFGKIGQFFGKVGQLFSQIGASIMGFLKPIITFISTTIQQVVTTIHNGIKTIVKIVKTIIKTVSGILKKVAHAVKSILDPIIRTAVNIFKKVVNGIKGAFKAAVSIVKGIAHDIIDGAKRIFSGAVSIIKGIFKDLVNGIKIIFKTAVSIVKGIAHNIINGAKRIFSGAVSIIKGIFKKVVNGIKSAFHTAVSIVKGIAHDIIDGAKKVFSGAVSIVKHIFNKIKKSITGPLKGINLFDIGSNIIKGLVKGFKSMVHNVTKAVKGIAHGIKKKFKSVFHIHSPSRVMRDEVGVFIPAGIAVGIDANAKQAYDSAESMAQGVIDTTSNKMKDFGVFDMGKQQAQAEIDIKGSYNLIKSMNDLKTEVQKGQQQSIYLDGNTLVGKTADRMDKRLGTNASTAGRYRL